MKQLNCGLYTASTKKWAHFNAKLKRNLKSKKRYRKKPCEFALQLGWTGMAY